MRFTAKTALVTGAGKNIGRAIALAFAREGANVIVCDINCENAEKVVSEIKAAGGNAIAGVCDVSKKDEVFAVAEEAKKAFGSVDILVNNAGGSAALFGKLSYFEDADTDTLDRVIDINLRGTMLCTKAVLPGMLEKKAGRIINMASIAGVCGITERVDYSAAKGGIIAFTKALAMELGPKNITVNAVSPGAIARDGYVQKNMTFMGEDGHAGKPEDIASMVLYLASDEARFVTGQNFIVDGGRTLGPMTQSRIR